MKASELRIGNIVKPCYEDSSDTVLILEPALIHLSNKMNSDNENDINGVLITEKDLEALGFNNENEKKTYFLGDAGIDRDKNSEENWVLVINYNKYVIKYIHELQNIIFINTGIEVSKILNMNKIYESPTRIVHDNRKPKTKE